MTLFCENNHRQHATPQENRRQVIRATAMHNITLTDRTKALQGTITATLNLKETFGF